MSIKRHFYNNKHYTIDKADKVIKLLPNFHYELLNKKLWGGSLKLGFKKIGGSSVGDVLEIDQWKSEFLAFCRMSWIGLPILNRKYVNAGIIIEPKVRQAIEKVTGEKVKDFPAKKYNFDYFQNKDDVVGGLPDGLLEKSKIVVEIKTSGEKNLEKWNQWGVPAAYIKQVELYTYLMGLKKYAIVATFLQEEDYKNPEKYPIEKRKMKSWKSEINENIVKDDIKKIKDWYHKYTISGISPKYNLVKDADQLKYLKCQNLQEWEKLQNKWKLEGKIPNE